MRGPPIVHALYTRISDGPVRKHGNLHPLAPLLPSRRPGRRIGAATGDLSSGVGPAFV
jgi:hypothetical protein